MVANDAPSIHSLLVANRVWLADGLLNVSGGGWATLNRVFSPDIPPLPDSSPPLSDFGIAVIVAVPWHQIKRENTLIIRIRDEDGKSIGNHTVRTFQKEYPSGMRPGSMLYRIYIAQMKFPFPQVGGYEVVTHLEDVDNSEKRWAFDVKDIQQK